jgi:ribose 5-phosphate isomerase B
VQEYACYFFLSLLFCHHAREVMRIALGSDHAGYLLKEALKVFLTGGGNEVVDRGTHSLDSVDYPEIAVRVALDVRDRACERGILVCGSGVGMSIAANKIRGVRAALAWNVEIARLSRAHNDANVLCLPGRFMDETAARAIAAVWLETPFEGGRHLRRLAKITAIEQPGNNLGNDDV